MKFFFGFVNLNYGSLSVLLFVLDVCATPLLPPPPLEEEDSDDCSEFLIIRAEFLT